MCSALNVQPQVEILRSGETIFLEPYARNILRVTLSLQHAAAVAAPCYGFVGAPERSGWTKTEFPLVHLLNRVS
jgi:alpha-D-xyloside xylohydrolase